MGWLCCAFEKVRVTRSRARKRMLKTFRAEQFGESFRRGIFVEFKDAASGAHRIQASRIYNGSQPRCDAMANSSANF